MDRVESGIADSPTVAVVIPVHDGADGFERCLEAVAALDPLANRVVVVGDGGGERALALARELGFDVARSPERRGPAWARNLGAAAVPSDLLLFVDADVAVPADVVARVREGFAQQQQAAALFGSYDDRPPAPGVVSRYKNLLHHWTHQHAATEASTFWTGCGAVRREVFESVGGFDPAQSWLEDVELGYRLRAAGHRVVLDRVLQVTHLKRWTLRRLLVSDVLHRAWPWTELAHRYRFLPRDLNLNRAGRASGLLSLVLVAALVLMVWWGWAAAVAAAAGAALVALNLPFYRFLARHGGLPFALGAVPLHWLYFLYGSVTYVVGLLWWTARGATTSGQVKSADPSDTSPSACRRSA